MAKSWENLGKFGKIWVIYSEIWDFMGFYGTFMGFEWDI